MLSDFISGKRQKEIYWIYSCY